MSKKELTFEQFVKAERGTTVEITMTGTIGEDGLVDVHGKKFPNDVLIYADTFYEIPRPFKVGDLASAGSIVHGIVEEIEQSGYLLVYGYHSKRGKIVTYRHHPEHFPNGINDMNLIDVLEMFCDWVASSKRHNDGNILKSIDINKERFNMPDELVSIMRNTAAYFEQLSH